MVADTLIMDSGIATGLDVCLLAEHYEKHSATKSETKPDIEGEIKDYFRRNGIERLSQGEVWKRLKEKFDRVGWGGKLWETFEFYSQKGYPVWEIPEYYDIFQNTANNYDFRIAFLKNMVELIDLFPKDDSGGHFFKGYDCKPEMVSLARGRAERLGLRNTHFYESDNNEPKPEEISPGKKVDILYNKSSLKVDYASNEIIAKRISKIFSRIKSGGMGILGGFTGDFSGVVKILENYGIMYRQANKLCDFDGNCPAYSFVFDVK